MEKDVKINEKEVVSIGVIPTLKVVFTPLEYVPTIPPLSSYVINICLYLAKIRRPLKAPPY